MEKRKYVVVGGKLNVRKSPKKGAALAAPPLDDGAVIEATQSSNGWLKVDGGYVMARYTEPVDAQGDGDVGPIGMPPANTQGEAEDDTQDEAEDDTQDEAED